MAESWWLWSRVSTAKQALVRSPGPQPTKTVYQGGEHTSPLPTGGVTALLGEVTGEVQLRAMKAALGLMMC